jgi:hypothetical protein
MARRAPWVFTGERNGAGEPMEWHAGIPARDLTTADVAVLSDEEYATVGASRLYRVAEVKAGKPAAAASTGGEG